MPWNLRKIPLNGHSVGNVLSACISRPVREWAGLYSDMDREFIIFRGLVCTSDIFAIPEIFGHFSRGSFALVGSLGS